MIHPVLTLVLATACAVLGWQLGITSAPAAEPMERGVNCAPAPGEIAHLDSTGTCVVTRHGRIIWRSK